MAFLFGRPKQKSASDLVRSVKEQIARLDVPGQPKAEEDLAKLLSQMKLILQGTQETDSSPDQVYGLVKISIQEDLLGILARSIHRLPFESRKDAQVIFSYVLRFKAPNGSANEALALNNIITSRPDIIVSLCKGYDHRESALSCGTVLREALKHDAVAAIVLYDGSKAGMNASGINPDVKQTGNGVFWRFFDWIDNGSFEVSADAFTTFKDILTRHKQLIAQYLTTNFDLFFSKYNSVLVQSSSYVTKRQSIKLLGEVLLARTNYQVMTTYVDRGEYLKLVMNLLKDDRKMVQYEGFHVFKVFVANPYKPLPVHRILWNNRERLLKFLPRFLEDRTEDDQFKDEKSFLIRQIETMPPPPSDPAPNGRLYSGAMTASMD